MMLLQRLQHQKFDGLFISELGNQAVYLIEGDSDLFGLIFTFLHATRANILLRATLNISGLRLEDRLRVSHCVALFLDERGLAKAAGVEVG